MTTAKQRVLTLEAPRQVRFRDVPLPPCGPDDVLIRARVSTLKHGTEMAAYSGRSPFANKTFDLALRLFGPAGAQAFYPRPTGNMIAGEVERAGANVSALGVGDAVFAWAPAADRHVLPAAKVQKLGALTPEQALSLDPASFALGAVLDGTIARGESVLVTGLGAIGLLAIQYCKARGATVIAASSFASRRALAQTYGATEVFDPQAQDDLARVIKAKKGGVDAAIECSGSVATLHLAIRAVRQCGRVVCVGFYGPAEGSLNLGEEFFHNRVTLLASLPALAWNNPVRGATPLYAKDLQEIAARDFLSGTLTAEGLFNPVVPFRDAVAAVELVANEPQRVVKVLFKHD